MDESEVSQFLQQYWQKYWPLIVSAIALPFMLGIGWKLYDDSQVAHAQEASTLFFSTVSPEAQEAYSADISQHAKEYALLQDEYADTVYADLVTFKQAKHFVEQKEYTKAISQLETLIDTSNATIFRDLARIRAAWLFFQTDKTKDALSILKSVEEEGMQAYARAVEGDILSADGQHEAARIAYKYVLDLKPMDQSMENVGFRTMIEQKMALLSNSR